jgi:hypothetical protein
MMARCSGALSIKPFERSRRAADADLWGLHGVEKHRGDGSDLRSGAQRAAWKEERSWERQVCGARMTVKSEKQRFVAREDAEGL